MSLSLFPSKHAMSSSLRKPAPATLILSPDAAHPGLAVILPTPMASTFSPAPEHPADLAPRYNALHLDVPSGSLALRRTVRYEDDAHHQHVVDASFALLKHKLLEHRRASECSMFDDSSDEEEDEQDQDDAMSEDAMSEDFDESDMDDDCQEIEVSFFDIQHSKSDSEPNSPDWFDAPYTPLPRKASVDAPCVSLTLSSLTRSDTLLSVLASSPRCRPRRRSNLRPDIAP